MVRARMRAGGRLTAGHVVVLGLLTTLTPLSIDLYLPGFPALRRDFGATAAMVQLTLAGMTIGLAAGQLLVGVWSDRVGRRAPLLASTGVHLLASVGCALAPSVEALAVLRVVQGIGAAGSAVLVLAIVRDLADGPALMILLTRVTLVTTTVPLLAPVAGAELLELVGWRGIFATLAVVSAAVLLATAVVIPETRARPSGPARLCSSLRTVCTDRAFRQATLVGSMTYGGVYAYVAASPLLLQQTYGLSARAYALVFLAGSLGLVAGIQLSSLLAKRFGAPRVLAGFTAVTVVAAAAIVPLQWAHTGLAGLLLCLWLFVAACGGCFPCAAAIALSNQGSHAGTATSVYGFTTFAVAGLVSPLAGLTGLTNATPVALVLLATSLTSLTGIGLLLRSRPTGPNPNRPRATTTSRGRPRRSHTRKSLTDSPPDRRDQCTTADFPPSSSTLRYSKPTPAPRSGQAR